MRNISCLGSDAPGLHTQEQSKSSLLAIGAEQGVVFWLSVVSSAALALLAHAWSGPEGGWIDVAFLVISASVLAWGWGGGILVRYVMLQQRLELKSD